MDDKRAHNARRDGSKWTPVLVAVISAAVGSVGGISIYLGTPVGQKVSRPDPFTGTQAAALTKRLDGVEETLTQHQLLHPDRELDARLRVLEAHYVDILRHLDRIEKAIEK